MTFNGTSGPHPSLQSEGEEAREAQFEVERACEQAPEPQHGITDLIRKNGSFPIWVKYPPKPPNWRRSTQDCGALVVYCVCPASRDWLLEMLGCGPCPPQSEFVVCEHMGRIIE
jgi:hypothetical protein